MRRIVFYGDSNTYGYDPRGFMGMRYPREIRWTEKVRNHFKGKYEIIEDGQNGRLLPSPPREEAFLKNLTEELSTGDLLFIMLGTNDILLTDHPDADEAVRKMNELLDWIKTDEAGFEVIIIGPVPISARSEDMRVYYEESVRMNAGFRRACEERGISCYDAADWDIALAYDGVHFSEDGCLQFAQHMIDIISDKTDKWL